MMNNKVVRKRASGEKATRKLKGKKVTAFPSSWTEVETCVLALSINILRDFHLGNGMLSKLIAKLEEKTLAQTRKLKSNKNTAVNRVYFG